MNRIARLSGLILLVAASAVGGYLLARHRAPEAPPAPKQAQILGQPRPDFSLPDIHGVQRHASEWDGKVVAVNFWATWCPPCRREIPEFVALQDRLGGRGLQFVGIALQRPEELGEFIRQYGINYPVLAGEMEVVRLAERYGNAIGALPYTVIVDRAGKIVFVRAGPLQGAQAEKIIQPLL